MEIRRFAIGLEQETDGRWIADVLALPGVLAYGATRDEAVAHAEALALRVLADRLEQRVASLRRYHLRDELEDCRQHNPNT